MTTYLKDLVPEDNFDKLIRHNKSPVGPLEFHLEDAQDPKRTDELIKFATAFYRSDCSSQNVFNYQLMIDAAIFAGNFTGLRVLYAADPDIFPNINRDIKTSYRHGTFEIFFFIYIIYLYNSSEYSVNFSKLSHYKLIHDKKNHEFVNKLNGLLEDFGSMNFYGYYSDLEMLDNKGWTEITNKCEPEDFPMLFERCRQHIKDNQLVVDLDKLNKEEKFYRLLHSYVSSSKNM